MTILFDATRPVKLTEARRFAEGLARRPSVRRMPYTAADLEWAAYELNKDATNYEVLACGQDREWDRRASEAFALDRLEAGCLF
jgi:hypothetical protein